MKLLLVLCLVGCDNSPQSFPDLALPDLALPPTDKIDILFVVDNSPSNPYVNELRARFHTLSDTLAQLPSKGAASSIHIGVVTTDLGSAQSTASSNCRPGGDGGRLQAKGRAAAASCQSISGNFIDIDQIAGTDNLPAGQDLATTFGCMADVGDQGCGFEHQLESAYKALHDDIPENAGFLREDAILVVYFVTDEDDCSAPPDSDLFDLNATQYGALLSYRCTNYGVMCGDPPRLAPYGDSGGPLSDCRGATAEVGGKLYDVQRYIDFFQTVKSDPRKVILASINAPATPFSTYVGSPQTGVPCAAGSTIDGTKCAALLGHSCSAGASFFGDPAVRLSQVIHSMPNALETSLCAQDYTAALQTVGDAIVKLRLGQ